MQSKTQYLGSAILESEWTSLVIITAAAAPFMCFGDSGVRFPIPRRH